MKFKVKGTKTTLAPSDKGVLDSYLARPDVYEPADAEAKKAAEARKAADADDEEKDNGVRDQHDVVIPNIESSEGDSDDPDSNRPPE